MHPKKADVVLNDFAHFIKTKNVPNEIKIALSILRESILMFKNN